MANRVVEVTWHYSNHFPQLSNENEMTTKKCVAVSVHICVCSQRKMVSCPGVSGGLQNLPSASWACWCILWKWETPVRTRKPSEARWSRDLMSPTQSIIVCVWNVQDAKEWMTKFAFQKRNVWSDCVAEGGWVGCQSVAEVGAELSLYDSIWHFFYWDLEILKQNHMALKFLLRIAQCQVNWNRSQKWCKGFWVSLGGEAGKRCTGGCSEKLWPLSQPEVDPQSCHWPLGKRMNWQFSQPQLALL